MIDAQNFLVTRDIALRTGQIQNKYRIADGRFVVDNHTLSRIAFTSEEIINGLSGVEKISLEDAKTLISQNGFRMGDGQMVEEVEDEQSQEGQEEIEQQTNENDE